MQVELADRRRPCRGARHQDSRYGWMRDGGHVTGRLRHPILPDARPQIQDVAPTRPGKRIAQVQRPSQPIQRMVALAAWVQNLVVLGFSFPGKEISAANSNFE